VRHAEFDLEGVGGLRLHAQSWRPDEEPTASVVISHGLAEHGGRYAHVAARLLRQGYAVYALDHRGHGRSQGPRANVGRFASLVTDLHGLVTRARQAQSALPVFLLGHSMGGAIALAYALEHQDVLRGLVLSAPALGAAQAVPAWQKRLIRLLSAVWPNAGALQLPAAAISRDPAVVQDYERDPLVYRGSVPARTVAELLAAMQRFPEAAGRLRLPVLVFHGTDDSLVPLVGVEHVYGRLGSADRTVTLYQGLYHEALNEPERERVLDDLVDWLERHR